MSKKIYFVQIAGKIDGVMYDIGDQIERDSKDAKSLLDLGLIAGDGNAMEAISAEEFAEVVNTLQSEIARLTGELTAMAENRESLRDIIANDNKEIERLESENGKLRELNSDLTFKIAKLESDIAEKEKTDQSSQTPEVKEPATEITQKTSKKKA